MSILQFIGVSVITFIVAAVVIGIFDLRRTPSPSTDRVKSHHKDDEDYSNIVNELELCKEWIAILAEQVREAHTKNIAMREEMESCREKLNSGAQNHVRRKR